MKEIILEKRYPHSREEDITDAFMRGYEIGKEQEHRWWSTFCANCKTDNCSEIPNNSAEQDEPQTQLTAKCLNCNNSKACKEKHWEYCRYEPLGYEVTAVVGTIKDEPQTDCAWK